MPGHMRTYHAKRLDNGKWVDGYYVCLNSKEHRIYTGYAETDCGDYYPDFVSIDPATVGQYAGWADKHGVRVFEHHVVSGFNDLHERHEVYVVKWDNNGFYLTDDCDTDWHPDHISDMEIIGNIIDNPELFNGSQTR